MHLPQAAGEAENEIFKSGDMTKFQTILFKL